MAVDASITDAPGPSSVARTQDATDADPTVDAGPSVRAPSEEGEAVEDEDPDDDDDDDTNPPLPNEAPPLPDEAPPLPDEEPPAEQGVDDGWDARFDANTGTWYFFNRFTLKSQWENPRMTGDSTSAPAERAPGTEDDNAAVSNVSQVAAPQAAYVGYNPKIHGDYDPNADYARYHEQSTEETGAADGTAVEEAVPSYEQSADFNRFTGKFQAKDRGAEYHDDENKSRRQMGAFFDVDQAANAHDGRSLKAERSSRRLSKKEAKEYNERRKAKKEQKRRDFLMS